MCTKVVHSAAQVAPFYERVTDQTRHKEIQFPTWAGVFLNKQICNIAIHERLNWICLLENYDKFLWRCLSQWGCRQVSINNLCPHKRFSSKNMTSHSHWARANRKQIVYSAVGCLVTENTKNEKKKQIWWKGWAVTDKNSPFTPKVAGNRTSHFHKNSCAPGVNADCIHSHCSSQILWGVSGLIDQWKKGDIVLWWQSLLPTNVS